MTTVRAPGSSANLGPGFDVLGAAIDRHAWVSDAGPLTGLANQTDSACGDDHLVTIAHQAAGGGPVWFAFDLRPGRGMGFSRRVRLPQCSPGCKPDGRSTRPVAGPMR
ncbi:MAG: hypothetical protein R2710_11435 [Acidimicrobiales bacterium]